MRISQKKNRGGKHQRLRTKHAFICRPSVAQADHILQASKALIKYKKKSSKRLQSYSHRGSLPSWLVRKINGTHRYVLTDKGRIICTAFLAARRAGLIFTNCKTAKERREE